ncbi:MAG: DHH family phosphoesterase [Lachnospiraceae bacterium]|jgi:single-stranded-DNA-specific exonuclease|nr:DHH family phosphoesterase [Lachnospiraceae bacterium]
MGSVTVSTQWMIHTKKADFDGIAKRFGTSSLLARVIRNRDVVGDTAIEKYLQGTLDDLYDPHLLKDLDKAVGILRGKIAGCDDASMAGPADGPGAGQVAKRGRGRAVAHPGHEGRAGAGRKIRIVGDYDIDGVCATYILFTALTELGADVDYEIPDRIRDGYGINMQIIEEAHRDQVDTILTCDNGIAAIEEIRRAKELGMTVIVTDHHEVRTAQGDGEGSHALGDESRYGDGGAPGADGLDGGGDLAPHGGMADGDGGAKGDAAQDSEILPPADAIVNPKQRACPYPFPEICGAVVAFKLVQALYEAGDCMPEAGGYFTKEDTVEGIGVAGDCVAEAGDCVPESGDCVAEAGASARSGEGPTPWDKFLEFAAIATVGDVMKLRDENRIIVKEGLKRVGQTRNLGLKKLIELNSLDPERLTAYHIGFVIGPCLNAGGRLQSAKLSLRLLLCKDADEAQRMAEDLKALNDSRKEMTERGSSEAAAQVEGGRGGDRVLVVYLPGCHESLAGIIAGRLRERFGKPAFVLTDAHASGGGASAGGDGGGAVADGGGDGAGADSDGDGAAGAGVRYLKGSGRSIEAYHMFNELVKVQDLLTKFGGHPMAAGLTLPMEALPEFRRRLNANCTLEEKDFVQKRWIDFELPSEYLTESFVEELKRLEPCGQGNERPVFAQRNLVVRNLEIFGKNRNVVKLDMVTNSGFATKGIWFGDGATFASSVRAGDKLDVLYYPDINEFRGARTLQLTLKDFRVKPPSP